MIAEIGPWRLRLAAGDWWQKLSRARSVVTAETALSEAPSEDSPIEPLGTLYATNAYMATVRTYQELEAWQSGMSLVEKCYGLSQRFPREEMFGLTAQLRRAAVSVPANLAEGSCRHTTNAFINHVSIALVSHGEVETCVEIAFRLGYVSAEQKGGLMETCDATGRLLNGLLRALQSR